MVVVLLLLCFDVELVLYSCLTSIRVCLTKDIRCDNPLVRAGIAGERSADLH